MRQSILVLILYFSFNVISSQNNPDITAKINIAREDIFVQIDAVAENKAHIFKNKLNYLLLSLKRKGTSNNYTKSEQFGEFTLLPNERKIISTVKLNIEKDQELKVYLFIKDKKQLLAQDSIKINEFVNILNTSSLKEEDIEIEIKGLVIDNAKTKIGKDFYDYFYQKYNSSGVKYAFVIDINEKPSIGGRGSLVSVEIGDDKIFEFQARPDEEMLKKAAAYSLRLVENYSKNRKTVKKNY